MFDGFELDGERDNQRIHREKPGCKSHGPRRLSYYHHSPEAYSTPVKLVDVVNGLTYMHELHVVHGDLKGVRNHSVKPSARQYDDDHRKMSS